ncbi:MAG TPA: helix-turn-helix transcriptional regulator [Bdellovibrio sp.]|uniref:helix-turn-helix transcriptional regulator n=1 Tax=Bdellovibrio sp. TaxID=28201 RepID=UPI002EEDBF3D
MAESALSQFLKEKRVLAGLSQKQVSDALGYSTAQFISNWERGLATPPIPVIKRLASLYKVEVQEITDLLLQETLREVAVDFNRKIKQIL